MRHRGKETTGGGPIPRPYYFDLGPRHAAGHVTLSIAGFFAPGKRGTNQRLLALVVHDVFQSC
jgi:hypothetical protein